MKPEISQSKPLSNRQLKRQRNIIYNRLASQMRTDFSYFLKPKKLLMPFNLWVWILDKLLYIDNESIKKICSTSFSKNK